MQAPSFTPRRLSRAASFTRRTLVPFAVAALMVAIAGCGQKNTLSPDAPSLARGATAVSSPAMARNATVSLDGPLHLEGTIGPGSLYSIDVPEQWNGDLVLYLHGYSSPSSPVALPNDGGVIAGLVERGYAVAASSYSGNGFALKEGVAQSHQLKGIFTSKVALPNRTFLLGKSLGGIIGLAMTEKFPDQYNGSLLISGFIGGSIEEVQYMGHIRVLFDAIYPGVLPGGLEHPPVITNEYTQVIQPVMAALNHNPQGLGLIQMLAPRQLCGNDNNEMATSLISVLVFSMQAGGDLFDRAHGHSYFDNHDYRYFSPALPLSVVDGVNAAVARYERTPDAENFLLRYDQPSGGLQVPVLTMHTTRDPVVPFWHEGLYAQVGAGPNLLQRQTVRYGHVTFTNAEVFSNFEDLVNWVNTGQKPAI